MPPPAKRRPEVYLAELRAREAVVEQWVAELDEEFPDPVDVLEDELAHALGLRRHPELGQMEWRRLRVRFIEAAEPVA